jgi:hypothetical protein
MTLQGDGGEKSGNPRASGFVTVWFVGISATLLVFSLTVSGTLWSIGFPGWLIYVTNLVGAWQWLWIAPILTHAPRSNPSGFHPCLHIGDVCFSVFQLSLCAVTYLRFRNFSFH